MGGGIVGPDEGLMPLLQVGWGAGEGELIVGFPVVMEKFWALRNYALLYKYLETI
jgi:hypothetical protein